MWLIIRGFLVDHPATRIRRGRPAPVINCLLKLCNCLNNVWCHCVINIFNSETALNWIAARTSCLVLLSTLICFLVDSVKVDRENCSAEAESNPLYPETSHDERRWELILPITFSFHCFFRSQYLCLWVGAVRQLFRLSRGLTLLNTIMILLMMMNLSNGVSMPSPPSGGASAVAQPGQLINSCKCMKHQTTALLTKIKYRLLQL